MQFIKNKEFNKFKEFDIVVVSLPSKHNITNMILAMTIEEIKPKLIGRFLFKDLPITIVSNNNINAPSIDLYFKKIKNKKYLFIIGNYNPKNFEFYKKFSEVIKKGKEIILLNEFEKKNENFLYIRKESTKSKIKVDIIKDNFKKINNAVIRGIPSFIFDITKNKKRNITILFFNVNSKYLENSINLLGEILGIDIYNADDKFKKQIENIFKENKQEIEKRNIRLNYIG